MTPSRDNTGPLLETTKELSLVPVMYDAVTPSNLPAGGDAYLGYADGRWADYLAIAAAHGNVPVYALTVFGTDGVGVGVDVEPGDATPQQAAQYIADTIAAGHVSRPIGYTMESWAKALVDAVTALGVPRGAWRLLTAHTSKGEHICGPTTCGCPVEADGTQWLWMGTYDQSLVTADFLQANSHPGDIVTPQDVQNIVNALTPVIEAQVHAQLAAFFVGEGLGRIVEGVNTAVAQSSGQITADVVAALKAQPPQTVSLKGETATVTFN